MASISSILLPILSKAKHTDLNDTPTSINIDVSSFSK